MRHWDKEFQSLPDDIKDPLMERVSEVKRLVKRFDDRVGGQGKLFTTIDRAFDMAWLASLRELARNKKRIGHGVKVKFDINEMNLLLRGLENCIEPFHCPHGRPTIQNINIQQLNRMFIRPN